ncbi:PP2C family protein-serine/threonine phosphatase [Streptomyces sp. NPDC002067]
MHAAQQATGDRAYQCDVPAARISGPVRAYAVLDGIGDSPSVKRWARLQALRLVNLGAAHADAETALRAAHAEAAAEPGRDDHDLPAAVAVLAVHVPGRLSVSWCGDSRAYYLPDGADEAQLLTRDHNLRQHLLDQGQSPSSIVPAARHTVLSCLGDPHPDPEIGATAISQPRGRLLLASDGAYEPITDACVDLATLMSEQPAERAARRIVRIAIASAAAGRADNATAVVADV